MSIIDFIRDKARYYNCPVCGRNLRGCEVRILDHEDERFTVQVTCAACRVTLVVVLAIQSAVNESVTEADDELVIEDVVAAEGIEEAPAALAANRSGDPIELDEVLEVHLLLREFQGSLEDLLQTPHR